jgi:hypothetical protein
VRLGLGSGLGVRPRENRATSTPTPSSTSPSRINPTMPPAPLPPSAASSRPITSSTQSITRSINDR